MFYGLQCPRVVDPLFRLTVPTVVRGLREIKRPL